MQFKMQFTHVSGHNELRIENRNENLDNTVLLLAMWSPIKEFKRNT